MDVFGMKKKQPTWEKRSLKDFISDLKILEEKVKDKDFRTNALTIIDNYSRPNSDLLLFDYQLYSFCRESCLPIRFALDENDLNVLNEARKAGAPSQAIDFLGEIVTKYGWAYAGYRSVFAHPDDWKHIKWSAGSPLYDPTSKDIILKTAIIKRSNEVVTFETDGESYLKLAGAILSKLVKSYQEISKTKTVLKIAKEPVRDIERLAKELQKLI